MVSSATGLAVALLSAAVALSPSWGAAAQVDLSAVEGATVWGSDFAEYEEGDLHAQDASWTVPQPDGSNGSATVAVISSRRVLRLRGEGVVASKRLPPDAPGIAVAGPVTRIAIEMGFPGSSRAGQLFTIDAAIGEGMRVRAILAPDGTGTLDGRRFRWKAVGGPHAIVLELDRVSRKAVLRIDRTVAVEQAVARLAAAGVTGLELSLAGGLECLVYSVRLSVVPEAEVYLSSELRSGYLQPGTETFRVARGQKLFSDRDVKLRTVPAGLSGQVGVRAPLNREQPLSVYCSTPGTLFAVLWTWDFGFLPHLPQSAASTVNGWSAGAVTRQAIRDAPEPFSTMRVYSREVGKGAEQVQLLDYVGQWVIVGFAPSATGRQPGGQPPACTLRGGRTRHNVVAPGQEVAVQSDAPLSQYRVFRNGSLVASGTDPVFHAPEGPGRYAVLVSFKEGNRLVPLTVGLGGPALSGWDKGFFPLHLYDGYGYTGLFSPNPRLVLDLQTIAMFEMGANTFFLRGRSELVEALGGRTLLNIRRLTTAITREVRDDEEAAAGFAGVLRDLGEPPPGIIGFYVEDEPKPEQAGRMARLEGQALEMRLGVPLLYTLHGKPAVAFWKTAGTTVRMTRSYPVRKSARTSLRAQIRRELADYLAACQQDAPAAPLWLVAQAFGDDGRPNLWDAPSPGHVRLMTSLALARGIRGLTFFCYDSSPRARESLNGVARWPFVPEDGRYEEVSRIFHEIEANRGFLTSVTWVGAFDSKDEGFDMQEMRGSDGESYVWITNWDTERQARCTVALPATGRSLAIDVPPAGSLVIDLRSGEPVLSMGGAPAVRVLP